MQKIKVYIDRQNNKLPFGVSRLIRRSCATALKCENFTDNAEINVSIVDSQTIKQLNCEYRNTDSITDVLSFPLGEDGSYDINPENNCYMLGDVVICMERAKQQAYEFGHSLKREISFLTVHSVLHLLGYDHVNNEQEEKIMTEKQKNIMTALGINR